MTNGITVLENTTILIEQPTDILDIIGNAQSNTVIIRKEILNEDFFRLETRFAGELLQKISNYNMRLGIVGDFKEYKSKNIKAFIEESNRGKQVLFVPTEDEAIRVFEGS